MALVDQSVLAADATFGWDAKYDPESDTFYKFVRSPIVGVMAYTPGANPPVTGAWRPLLDATYPDGPHVYLDYDKIAHDRGRRQLYGVDFNYALQHDPTQPGRFVRYDIATNTIAQLPSPPHTENGWGITFNGCVFSHRHDCVFFLPHPGDPTTTSKLHAYHVTGPLAGTWETLSLDTGLGFDAFGRNLFYDEEGDALVAFGQGDGNDFRQHFMFLYRYGGVQPPVPPPVPPPPLPPPTPPPGGTMKKLRMTEDFDNLPSDTYTTQTTVFKVGGPVPSTVVLVGPMSAPFAFTQDPSLPPTPVAEPPVVTEV